MYFQIENTPEHVRRARRPVKVRAESPQDSPARLVLAPFSRPPQVVFDNIPIGTACERHLEVYNPTKQAQQITLGKALPPGLIIHIPDWLTVEPDSLHTLTLSWTPLQPTALRETLRFTNESRGRYDVIVVLKSAHINIKGKTKPPPKSYKISPPGKMKKKLPKKSIGQSPVAIYKRKSEAISKTYDFLQPEMKFKSSNKENIPSYNNQTLDISHRGKCPFGSPDFTFNTSEIFSTIRRTHDNFLQNTFENSYNLNNALTPVQNVLKPAKSNVSGSELFDNLTFTPLKTGKTEMLEKGPNIVFSVNSETDFDDSLEKAENETHSIICASTQPPNKWITVEHQEKLKLQIQNETQTFEERPFEAPLNQQAKKIPNTSSPKEIGSPNFSINTDFSRISELSFLPPRFSTERKTFPKFNSENRELFDEALNSDTFTKYSPNTPRDPITNMFEKPPHYFMKDAPKSRQALFKESYPQKEGFSIANNYEVPWQNEMRPDLKSPRTSLTPPLQSIPEESTQFSETQVLDRTDRKTSTFTINKTFEKPDRSSFSAQKRQTWTKTAIRADAELWKIPSSVPRKSIKPQPKVNTERDSISSKMSATFDTSRHSLSITQIGNVYSQAATVDPFSSATYFYDEEAVHKFETEFKRWLNCILTPPADLESNVEEKIDVGKAWIENRNKDVPLAPTKEQVSSKYHDSQRLAKLRRSARNLLKSPEIIIVIQKLNAQIEKKLIAIRTDRNLHLDIGLQRAIMEILLSYNPLWLRIGLEAIYGIVLPLRSNSDVEGLTSFIIQRLFKNPFLKNKQAKSNAPNMLLPAYMEAIKKYTLKKFFILVLFLDQAKEKKLIPHDPCLFCRNAICKESREIIIRFTRELIAGIGDITRHLRPLGYVVTHKQSYLDEYKFAVHNLALDIRDGVRLTKVMEIILMKDGLLKQLRTPAISRLQKIHNVQVAFNALKEANFVISGDITATDIADGHREKTLSLLWQLIHEFRAPLFERAANVIQIWWRKKYEVIVEKRIQEERILQKKHLSASIIQNWWRTIQYNRMLEWQRQRYTSATVVIQKYWRMALQRNRYLKLKTNIARIEQWYLSMKQMRLAKMTLEKLKLERQEMRRKSATVIQSQIRRWLCMHKFKATIRKVIIIQSLIRSYLARQSYLRLQKAAVTIQERYRGKLLMRQEMQKLLKARQSATLIQSWYKMLKQRQIFLQLKNSVKNVEERYIALIKMREELRKYKKIKQTTILIQARFRANRCRQEFTKKKNAILTLQRKLRAHLLMKEKRTEYFILRNSAIVLQRHIRSYLLTKKTRNTFLIQRKAVITIQKHYRTNKLAKAQRKSYFELKIATLNIQNRYRSLLAMRKQRSAFLEYKRAAITIQRRYRAQVLMESCKKEYSSLKNAATILQQRYRAQMKMRLEKTNYLKLKSACLTIQTYFRARLLGLNHRQHFLEKKQAAIKIQSWLRNCRKGKEIKQEFIQTKQACMSILRIYRAYIIGRKQRQEYIKIRTATICIQKYYRSYIEMKTVRNQYIQLKEATVTIQRHFKSYLETKKQQMEYLKIKSSATTIQRYFRSYIETKRVRQEYCKLKISAVTLQRIYRGLCAMRKKREQFLRLKKAAITIQHIYRALLAMRVQREAYFMQKSAAIILQRRYRAQIMMRTMRLTYVSQKNACIAIQRHFRAYLLGTKQKYEYTKLKQAAIVLQQRYRALIMMRKERHSYLMTRKAGITLQRRYRARQLMLEQKNTYQKILQSTITIQKGYKAYIVGKKQRQKYLQMKSAATTIQRWIRNRNETRKIRTQFLELKKAVILIQRRYKAILDYREQTMMESAYKIQQWYRATKQRNEAREKYLKLKKITITLQSKCRMKVIRKDFLQKKEAALTIQRNYRFHKFCQEIRQTYKVYRQSVIKMQSFLRMIIVRKRYLTIRSAVITIQAAYRLKKQREIIKKLRENSAIIIQKNVRKFLAESKYQKLRRLVIHIQNVWRGKLITRLLRCEFLQKRRAIISIQTLWRGCLTRKRVESLKLQLAMEAEDRKRTRSATVIQAFYRGYSVRSRSAAGALAALVRERWRGGALLSKQESLRERHEDAMMVLQYMYDIESVIRAFRSLEILTEVMPTMYKQNAVSVVRHVHCCMSVTNRSVSSVEVLKSAAAVLVNLTRYSPTGPDIYNVTREHVPQILKFMLRFSTNEPDLPRILCTHLWLFTKYPHQATDLAEYLKQPDNHKMLSTIKSNVERLVRMANNFRNKMYTPNTSRFVSHAGHNYSLRSNKAEKIVEPALEPDYGLTREDRPKYFKDAHDAINSLFKAYGL